MFTQKQLRINKFCFTVFFYSRAKLNTVKSKFIFNAILIKLSFSLELKNIEIPTLPQNQKFIYMHTGSRSDSKA